MSCSAELSMKFFFIISGRGILTVNVRLHKMFILSDILIIQRSG